MCEMRREALTLAVLVPAVIAGAAAAHAGSPPSPTDLAVVSVATPELPTGPSPEARSRWRELRSRSREILDRVSARNGLAVKTAIPEIGQLSVELGPGGLAELRRRLADDPRVESVRPDVPVQLRYAPNDPAFTTSDPRAPAGDLTQWNVQKEGGPRAWDFSRGIGAEVAMVDSGADGGHPDLGPRIVGAQSFGTGAGATTDADGHGTHTAGLACGNADNGYGLASLGFQCGLFIAKIAIGGSCSNVSNAVVAAANRNSDVINMSLGDCDPSIVPALDYAQARGAVIVVAGDNNPNPTGACGGLADPTTASIRRNGPSRWVPGRTRTPTAAWW